MRRRAFALLLVLPLVLVACGGGGSGDDDDDDARDRDATNTPRAKSPAAGATEPGSQAIVPVDKPATVGDLKITVTDAEFLSPAALGGRKPDSPDTDWVRITLHIDNLASSTAKYGLGFSISCGSADGDRYPDDIETDMETTAGVPARSSIEGTMLFGFQGCDKPVLTAKATGSFTGEAPKPASWTLR